MTRQEAGRYAAQCSHAMAHGLPKPERPDKQTNSLQQTSKAITATATRLQLLNSQMEMLVDFLYEFSDRSPVTEPYAKIANYIWGELMEAESTLKRIK